MDTAYSHTDTRVDLTAFDNLYHQYHQAVYANIWKMVKHTEMAEDILQEVFLALWQNREKLDTDRVAGWLFVTSYHKSIRHLKQKIRERAVPLEETAALLDMEVFQIDGVNTEEIYQLRISMLEEAVAHLPARKKEVFRLCRYEGKSYEEVASLLGLTPSSVKDYLKQSTRFIKDYIFSHHAETGMILTPLLISYLAVNA